MSAAFWTLRVETTWFPPKPIQPQAVTLVYPAVTAMMIRWKSAGDGLEHAHRRLSFAQPPAGAGLPADIKVRRDLAWPRAAANRLGSLVTVYQDQMTPAALAAVHPLAVVGTMPPKMAALQETWNQWGIPSQTKKAFHRTDDWETFSCRVAGTLGVLAPPRAHWMVLRCNSAQPQRVSDSNWQMVAILSVPARRFLRIRASGSGNCD